MIGILIMPHYGFDVWHPSLIRVYLPDSMSCQGNLIHLSELALAMTMLYILQFSSSTSISMLFNTLLAHPRLNPSKTTSLPSDLSITKQGKARVIWVVILQFSALRIASFRPLSLKKITSRVLDARNALLPSPCDKELKWIMRRSTFKQRSSMF